MANSVCWEFTELPVGIIDILEDDIKKFDSSIEESKLKGDRRNSFIRNSQNTWIPTSQPTDVPSCVTELRPTSDPQTRPTSVPAVAPTTVPPWLPPSPPSGLSTWRPTSPTLSRAAGRARSVPPRRGRHRRVVARVEQLLRRADERGGDRADVDVSGAQQCFCPCLTNSKIRAEPLP